MSKNSKILQIPKSDFEESQKNQFVLLQLPKNLNVEDLGGSSIMKASSEQGGKAKLVTIDQSFELIKVESSNTYIMMNSQDILNDGDNSSNSGDESNKKQKVCITSRKLPSHFLELKQTVFDRFELLQFLDSKSHYNPYLQKGDGDDIENLVKGYTIEELIELLSTSRLEIKNALQELSSVVNYKNKYYSVHEEPLQDAMSGLLAYINETTTLDYDAMKVDECIDGVRLLMNSSHDNFIHLPDFLLSHCLYLLTVKSSNEGIVKLNEDRLALMLAHNIFLTKAPPTLSGNDDDTTSPSTHRQRCWTPQTFLEEWKKLMPGTIIPRESLLKGIALEINGYYQYFPHTKLPMRPTQRFAHLFEAKSKWSLDELRPYVEGITLSDQAADILVKHCRVVVDSIDGKQWYQKK